MITGYELAILMVLDSADPRLLKRAVLEAELRLTQDAFNPTAFDSALARLADKRQIRIHQGEDVTRYALTDEGRERVAAAR